MNFIIQEHLTLDVEHPVIFGENIQDNLNALVYKHYCGKFINNRYYVKILEIISHSDIFIQSNNSGLGSITCIVKFLSIVYAQNTLIFDLKIVGSEVNKNINVYKCTSDRYPNITFMTPSMEKINDEIPLGNIVTIAINKASENIIIFDIIKKVHPIMLPFDFTEELSHSEINKEFLKKLGDKTFNDMFEDTAYTNGDEFYAYIRGEIHKVSKIINPNFKNFTNISDRELCWDLFEKSIYNFIHF